MKTNPNDPAYPAHPALEKQTGLTKLEAFTMAAIQGLCANTDLDIEDDDEYTQKVVSVGIGIAKSTIEALNKEQEEK